MSNQAVVSEDVPIEDLRRRVYSPRATDEDRARYRAALEATERTEPTEDPAPPPRRVEPVRRHRPLRALGPAAAVIAAIAIAVPLVPRSPSAPTYTAPHAAPPAATVIVNDEARSGFIQKLEHGGASGIAAYLVAHRPPPRLGGSTRFDTIERDGTGPGLVTLDPTPALPTYAPKGHASVVLVTDGACRAGWTAYRVRFGGDGLSTLEPEAGLAGGQQGGVPTTGTFSYRSGEQPVRLRIDVPDGIRWGVALVFSD